jgi:metal-responsive CopG/Arc/MetJ family transcriptional regulator
MKENWEKEFDKIRIKEKKKSIEEKSEAIKDIIRQLLKSHRQEIIERIEKLILDEIIICHKEGTPTSRLTSLDSKIKTLKQ